MGTDHKLHADYSAYEIIELQDMMSRQLMLGPEQSEADKAWFKNMCDYVAWRKKRERAELRA